MMLTTVITDITPITTPSRVSMVRNLCAHRLAVAMRTASPNVMEVLSAIVFWVLLNIRANGTRSCRSQNKRVSRRVRVHFQIARPHVYSSSEKIA